MNNFAVALNLLIDEKGIRVVRIAEKTGIDNATLSRIRSGTQKSIEMGDVNKIIKFFKSKTDQKILATAFAQDHVPAALGMSVNLICSRR